MGGGNDDKNIKKPVFVLPMLAFPSYAVEVSTQSDCQFAAERTKLTVAILETCWSCMSFLVHVIWMSFLFLCVCNKC